MHQYSVLSFVEHSALVSPAVLPGNKDISARCTPNKSQRQANDRNEQGRPTLTSFSLLAPWPPFSAPPVLCLESLLFDHTLLSRASSVVRLCLVLLRPGLAWLSTPAVIILGLVHRAAVFLPALHSPPLTLLPISLRIWSREPDLLSYLIGGRRSSTTCSVRHWV